MTKHPFLLLLHLSVCRIKYFSLINKSRYEIAFTLFDLENDVGDDTLAKLRALRVCCKFANWQNPRSIGLFCRGLCELIFVNHTAFHYKFYILE